MQPGIAAAVAGRPDHRRRPRRVAEVEPARRGDRPAGCGRFAGRTSSVRPWAAMWPSIRSRTRRSRWSAWRWWCRGRRRSWRCVRRRTSARPVRRDAAAASVARSTSPPSVPSDELQRWLAPGVSSGAHLVDGAVERADPVEPPEDVHASIAAWHAGVAADGEVHLASGAAQLVGELHPGGRGADDEHAAVGELAGSR